MPVPVQPGMRLLGWVTKCSTQVPVGVRRDCSQFASYGASPEHCPDCGDGFVRGKAMTRTAW